MTNIRVSIGIEMHYTFDQELDDKLRRELRLNTNSNISAFGEKIPNNENLQLFMPEDDFLTEIKYLD